MNTSNILPCCDTKTRRYNRRIDSFVLKITIEYNIVMMLNHWHKLMSHFETILNRMISHSRRKSHELLILSNSIHAHLHV